MSGLRAGRVVDDVAAQLEQVSIALNEDGLVAAAEEMAEAAVAPIEAITAGIERGIEPRSCLPRE